MEALEDQSIVMSVSVRLRVCACLYASISPKIHVRSSPNFVLHFIALARSSFDGVVICYILPVLWMTSYLHVS